MAAMCLFGIQVQIRVKRSVWQLQNSQLQQHFICLYFIFIRFIFNEIFICIIKIAVKKKKHFNFNII